MSRGGPASLTPPCWRAIRLRRARSPDLWLWLSNVSFRHAELPPQARCRASRSAAERAGPRKWRGNESRTHAGQRRWSVINHQRWATNVDHLADARALREPDAVTVDATGFVVSPWRRQLLESCVRTRECSGNPWPKAWDARRRLKRDGTCQQDAPPRTFLRSSMDRGRPRRGSFGAGTRLAMTQEHRPDRRRVSPRRQKPRRQRKCL
jgi:hypothetical protein